MKDTAGKLCMRCWQASIRRGGGVCWTGLHVHRYLVSVLSKLKVGLEVSAGGCVGSARGGSVSASLMDPFASSMLNPEGRPVVPLSKGEPVPSRLLEPELLVSGGNNIQVPCLRPFLQARHGGLPS